MILGVGTDLIEIKRMEKACRRPHFVARTFTETESRQAKGSASKLAGSFAVKEAVAKMFGTGFRGFMPEISRCFGMSLENPMSIFTAALKSDLRKWG